MKNNVLLYILLVFLVVMNAFFLFQHFGSTEIQDAPRRGPARFISEELNFDAAQTEAFERLDVLHREQMNLLLHDIKVAKDDLYDFLSDDTINNQVIDSLAAAIGKKEAAKDVETFLFFKAVRKLCNEDQKLRFEAIIKDALSGRPGPPRRNGPPDRGGPPHGGRDKENRPPHGF